MKRADAVTALIFMALGGAALYQTTLFDQTLITDNYLGATFFPRMVAIAMIAMAISLLWGSRKAKAEGDGEPMFGPGILRPLAGAVIVGAYSWALGPLGFIISTVILNLAILLTFGVKKIPLLLMLPIGATLIIYWVFYKLLTVPLPEGIFFL
ncbi:tripartite tricarboxylate transporter TctB family protein [Dethiosulfovibrio sp. F2B]|uniref:tripartite tricarboxylate transporter TctB family protein n=1 Tax=Dethiosulfovibrio faecalis TaxID=2720018 RepID=UPI001F1EDC93|nr:tripartite tricarboxylate transporter TctB family protein [Dethiosulfovibrio faecalis]MCF4151572.1 tripartite tricarboxylate transporter TctB family protein [Dethiosulfovibrio faecalis]